MIIDQRIKRKHIFTACNRTCMESKEEIFFCEKQNSRLWEHNSDSNKKGAELLELQLQRTQKGNLASEFIQPKAYII